MNQHLENLLPDTIDASQLVLDCRGRSLDCRPGIPQGAHVMGILNVTPDSFSDGGLYLDEHAALKRVEQMVNDGAAIIDVGGESSRPKGTVYGQGAAVVASDEEMRRVVPVIEAIAHHFPDVLISIDTYKPEVAKAALQSGAHIVNDITGLRVFPAMAQVTASFGSPLIVMHSLGRPGAMPHEHHYENVVTSVSESLREAIKQATTAGTRHIITDPGFGFGKSIQENLALIAATRTFLALGYPVLVGVSRKSTIGAVLRTSEAPAPVHERLYGSLGATATAVLRGATLVRTHDVRPTVEMLRLLAATAFENQKSLK